MPKIDPRERLTEFITEGEREPEQKTNLTCKEQLAYYDAWLSLGREPGLEFFAEEVRQDMELMMSLTSVKSIKPRSEQVKEMFMSIDQEPLVETGLRAVTEYHKARRPEVKHD